MNKSKLLFNVALCAGLLSSSQAFGGRLDSLLKTAKSSDTVVKKAMDEAAKIQKLKGELKDELGIYFQARGDDFDWEESIRMLRRDAHPDTVGSSRVGTARITSEDTVRGAFNTLFNLIERSDDFVSVGYGNPIDYIIKENPDALTRWINRYAGEGEPRTLLSSSNTWNVIASRSTKIMNNHTADVMGEALQGDFIKLREVVTNLEAIQFAGQVPELLVNPSVLDLATKDISVLIDEFQAIVDTLHHVHRLAGSKGIAIAKEGLEAVLKAAKEEGKLTDLIVKLDGASNEQMDLVEDILDSI